MSRLFFGVFSYITTELNLEISYISDIPRLSELGKPNQFELS